VYTSSVFLKTVEFVDRKRHSLSLGDALEKLKQSFQSEMKDCPSGLNRQVFTYFLGPAGASPEITNDLVERAHKLGDVIDLFAGEYNDQNDDFTEEEWLFLKECASEYAEEMDMQVLTAVMSRIMDRGLL
jgi:hypothetical protein